MAVTGQCGHHVGPTGGPFVYWVGVAGGGGCGGIEGYLVDQDLSKAPDFIIARQQ